MPQESLAPIIQRIEEAAAALRAQAAGLQDEVLAAFRRSEAQLMARVAALVTEAPLTESTKVKVAWYLRNAQELESLVAAPDLFGSAVGRYVAGYQALADLSSELLLAGTVGQVDAITSIPPELIQAIRGRDLAHFNFLNQEAYERLDQVLLDSILTTNRASGVLADLRGVIVGDYPWGNTRGLYEWHAGTYARTAHLRFTRTLQGTQAQAAGVERFLYVGAADGKVRAFCSARLGKVFTRDQIEQMDNGQTGNVFTDGGGWNCRHVWAPVLDAVANAINAGQDTVLLAA